MESSSKADETSVVDGLMVMSDRSEFKTLGLGRWFRG